MKLLEAQRILVTRSLEEQEETAQKIRERGGIPIACPMISLRLPKDTTALDNAIQNITDFTWIIFTSANSVRFFFERFRALPGSRKKLEKVKLAAIGPATEATIEQFHRKADFTAAESTGDAFMDEFSFYYPVIGNSFLLPLSDIAHKTIPDQIKVLGGRVRQVVTYCNDAITEFPADIQDALEKDEVDWVIFTSSSTVDNFFDCLGDKPLPAALKTASIGPKTSETLRNRHGEPTVEASEHILSGLLDAMEQWKPAT